MNVFILLILTFIGICESRTVDAAFGRNAAMLNALTLQNGNGIPVGLNDIQGGLVDKDEPEIEEYDYYPDVESSTPVYMSTVPEMTDVDINEANEEVEKEKKQPEEEKLDGFDMDLIENESDLAVVVRRMYEALTKRFSLLNSRVTTVEKNTADILARLTDFDCSDLLTRGQKNSGIYNLHMDHNGKRPIDVVCDMDTDGGGWTVIQRRTSASKDVDFNRGWFDYKMGFGNASGDFWIGLENIHIWTNTRHYEMRIDLTDFNGDSAYALYDRFFIEGEDSAYRIHISGYSGNSGDALCNLGKADNFTADGMSFTTIDEDHDTSHEINCAKYWKIGGWWFNRCSWANLNGPYKEPGEGDGIGMNWHMWKNKEYLRTSSMMIRPSRNL